MVLKRLEDALRDRDSIPAVIKGAAINNDGSSKMGYTSHRASTDRPALWEMAQTMAGADPESDRLYGSPRDRDGPGRSYRIRGARKSVSCAHREEGFLRPWVPSKSNIGHLDAASLSIAGVIKTVLALEHEVIPPTLHYREPNPTDRRYGL